MASRKNILLLFGMVLAALLVDGFSTYRNLLRWSEDNQWVVHTQKVIISIEEVRSSFRFFVNRYQAYLLTGKNGYLSDLKNSSLQRLKNLDSLRELTGDNLERQKELEGIKALAEAQDEIYRKSLQAWRKGRANHGQEIAWAAELNRLADQIREMTIAATKQENVLLLDRTAESSKTFRQTLWIFGLSLVGIMLLVLYTLYLFNRGLRMEGKLSAAERETLEKKRLLDSVLQNMSEGIVVADKQGKMIYFNKGAEKITGMGISTHQSSQWVKEYGVFKEDKVSLFTEEEIPLVQAVRGVEVDNNIQFLRNPGHPDGIFVSVNGRPLRDEKGNLAGGLVVVRDITEQIKSDEALKTYNRKLEENNRDLQDFVFVASHDLQEPLRKIQSFGEFLRDEFNETLGETGRAYVERMRSAAKRMQILINDLLALTRVTTKAKPFARVDLSQVLQEVLVDLETRIQEKNAKIESGPLPVLEADATQMRQLFQNLISNGLKFQKDGIPPLIQINAHGNGRNLCRITVKDNGIGFDSKYAEQIFKVFERLHGRDEYEGTGIGLAICRKVAERHGGTIKAEGVPGTGSNFTIELPLKQE